MKMTFPEFMKEFWWQWLLHNWEKTVQNEMLSTHLDLECTWFKPWAAQIMAHNISLHNTKSFMTDEQLQVQLEIMLDPELQIMAHKKKTNEINDLQE